MVVSILGSLSEGAGPVDEPSCDDAARAPGEAQEGITGAEDILNQSGVPVNEDPLDELDENTPGKLPLNTTLPDTNIIGRDRDDDQIPNRLSGEKFSKELPRGVSRTKKVLTTVGDGASKVGDGVSEKVIVPTARGVAWVGELPSKVSPESGAALVGKVKDGFHAILDLNPLRNVDKKPVQYGLDDVQVAAMASTGAIFLIGAILSGSSSAKTTAYLSPLVPLYSRIKKEQVFKHERRQHLYQLVGTYPGISFNHLKRQMKLENGTLRHHLLTLEREHYIKSIKDGKKRRFYLNGRKVSPLSRTQQEILRHIKMNPKISQSEIAQLMKVSRQNVNYHIKKMEKQHILRVRQDDAGPNFELFERRW